ncbi:hypothetical protein TSUD_211340 [Trifolium subterraneum]|uniref:MADS-box domain-containing protein n=1 Tax=Trifolium subterraneum TaxID=3900 RepID=A0A2Z6P0N6_TRISU|nr:hypothetical protein TSUD_211340 [Trifolium subterraneum]
MTRGKVKLSFIVNEEARKATYKKRKDNLLKKVGELSTLCGIDACAIVYGPYEPEPEICPTPDGVQRMLSKFMTLPEFEKCKKMVNQEAFMKHRVMKAEEQLKRLRKNNIDIEMENLISQCIKEGKVVHNNMSMIDLNALTLLIDQNLKDIGRRMEAEEMPMVMGDGHVEMVINNDDIMPEKLFMDLMISGHRNDANLQN